MGQHKIMVRTLRLAGLTALVLSGCSSLGVGDSEFLCNKSHAGMPCDSVEEVYRRTNGNNWRASSQSKAKGDADIAPPRPASVVPVNTTAWPTPVLEPAQVLRVWIAPWVDDKQALHWPSYVFTEVTPRKWSFGNADFRGTRQLTPLQVTPRDEGLVNDGDANPADTSNGTAGGAQISSRSPLTRSTNR